MGYRVNFVNQDLESKQDISKELEGEGWHNTWECKPNGLPAPEGGFDIESDGYDFNLGLAMYEDFIRLHDLGVTGTVEIEGEEGFFQVVISPGDITITEGVRAYPAVNSIAFPATIEGLKTWLGEP